MRLILVAFAASLLLGCGLISNVLEEASNQIEIPDFELEPEQLVEADSEPGPDTLNLDDPSLYQYRDKHFTTSLAFEFDSEVEGGAVYIHGAWAAGSPPASTFTFDSTLELFAAFAPMEFANQGGVLYSATPLGGCSVEEIAFDDPFDSYYMDQNYLTGEATLLSSGVELNGMIADEYRITDANELGKDQTAFYDFIATDTTGSIFVDRHTGVIVRFTQEGKGLDRSQSAEGVPIDYSLQLDFVLLDSPPDISLPEGCEEGFVGDQEFVGGSVDDIPWPVLPDAHGITAAFGVYGYESDLTLDEAVDFYRTEMAALGFAVETEAIYPPTALLEFVDGSGSLLITIADEGEAGLTIAIVDTTSP